MKRQRNTQPSTTQEPTYIDAPYLTTSATEYPHHNVINMLSKHKDIATHQTQYMVEWAPEQLPEW
jgi:hypothetical protein